MKVIALYHGTYTAASGLLVAGQIDVNQGGGEFGRGFYVGNDLHSARTWAFWKQRRWEKNNGLPYESTGNGDVVEFRIRVKDRAKLLYISLSVRQAIRCRWFIRRIRRTHIYVFGVDVVYGPIVGGRRHLLKFRQHKFESVKSEQLINSANVQRNLI